VLEARKKTVSSDIGWASETTERYPRMSDGKTEAPEDFTAQHMAPGMALFEGSTAGLSWTRKPWDMVLSKVSVMVDKWIIERSVELKVIKH
jgi:hypothetical protein